MEKINLHPQRWNDLPFLKDRLKQAYAALENKELRGLMLGTLEEYIALLEHRIDQLQNLPGPA